MRHFLKENDFSREEAQAIFSRAREYKANRFDHEQPLEKQSWGVLLYKNSTRTRISFEVGIKELGGYPIILSAQNTQIGRGETSADTSRIFSRYMQGIIIRTFAHSIIEEFASVATIPVINGLTDFNHPCQLYTDLFSLLERYDPETVSIESLKGKKVTFFGDTTSNMATSWIYAASYFGMHLTLCGPEGFEPSMAVTRALEADGLKNNYTFETDPLQGVKGADVLYTDVWFSMGDDVDPKKRKKEMAPYQVSSELLAQAAPDAHFLHCLPAHAGEEVSQEVLDSPQSIIFDEAENRLHTQKAIMAKLAEVNA